jgi:hypothetical protein
MVKVQPTKKVYWAGNLNEVDDFNMPYGKFMYDGKLRSGTQWANMSDKAWRMYGCGKLGTGFGQKYEKQSDGQWLKVEG